ncbi:hypothetical protein ACT8ZV_04115 [Nocardioides sp. MAHUQ-72]|uniref:hypothetical protein n=1 Tax=unclassified Nocardioides TaxID=2615069 RepID=UPI003621B6FC
MTNSSDETSTQGTGDMGIGDDDLPEDLQPTEDNPLAQPLDDEVDPGDLDMEGGKGAEEWDDEELED